MQKKTSFLRQNIFPVLAAFIWGTAFAAQSVAADSIEAFTFNAVRSVIAFVTLLIASVLFARLRAKRGEGKKRDWRALITGGVSCGVLLTVAANLQQLGLAETSAGKAGFITALYVVLVPIFGIFFRRRATLQVWIGALLAVAGLYFLCITDSFTVSRSDFYVFLCAIVFAIHIFCIDHFVAKADGVELSCVQFLTVAVISGVCALIFETPTLPALAAGAPQLLYCGVLSSGVAYTLQILSQKDSDPTVVTILLSLESVFSVLAGAVLLGDRLSGREYLGCGLMFAAVLLAQVPLKKKTEA